MKCWICGNDGTTGEHSFKASDIQLYFPSASSKSPIYIHKKHKKNIVVQGKKSDRLKSQALICSHCNDARTQKHDNAWKALSSHINRNGHSIAKSKKIKLKDVYKGNSKKSGINLQLYFLKLFGCLLVESKNDILAKEFADCIVNKISHPKVYLYVIKCKSYLGAACYGISGLTVVYSLGSLASAGYEYMIGDYCVVVRYASPDYCSKFYLKGWQPTGTSKYLKLSKRLPFV